MATDHSHAAHVDRARAMHTEMRAAPQDNETQSAIVERHMRAAHAAGDDTGARALFYSAQVSGQPLPSYETLMERIAPKGST